MLLALTSVHHLVPIHSTNINNIYINILGPWRVNSNNLRVKDQIGKYSIRFGKRPLCSLERSIWFELFVQRPT